jgi:DNA helicase II / ATP-dependent DNA helicase PcrA
MGLNPQQQSAAEHKDGPLLILAGAGSGKTTVLMNRIANLINNGVKPWNILAVTFANKAANEMRERIGKSVNPEVASKTHLSTFHSFCVDVLRREWKHLDMFEEKFDISEPSNSSAYLKGIIKGKTKVKSTTILKYISELKNEMVDAESLKNWDSNNPHIDWEKVRTIIQETDPKHLEVVRWAYPAYENIMRKKNMVDFDDLILLTVKLFLEHPSILQKYQERFKYIMVDEYQDTNRSQYILIKLLAEKCKNIAVVGDDFQSIYAFRGSDIRNILNFDEDYPDAKIIKLEQNYRSTKTIIEAANQVISQNEGQKKKTLFTENPIGEKVTVFRSDYPEDGAEYIAQTIQETVDNTDKTYKDFTILYRNNSLSADVEVSLSNNQIPFIKLSGRSFFDLEEIQDIVKYLEFIHNPNSLSAFSRVIRKPKRRIAEKTIKKIEEEFYGENLLNILEDLSYIERVQKTAVEEGKIFAKMIRKYQEKKNTISVATLIKELLEEIKYEEKILSSYDKARREEKLANIDKLIEMIQTKEEKTGTTIDLGEYVEEIMLYNADDEDNSNSVKLMTIHGSKGLEFPIVFVLGMNEEVFPAFYAQEIDEVEEERRMCYVAFTRAKEKLYLTHASRRILKNKQTKHMYPSRFIDEFNDELKFTID